MTETLEVKRFEWYLPGDSSRDLFGMVSSRDPNSRGENVTSN